METYLETKAIDLIEEEARYARDRILIRILFHLGCRVSEALALTVDDIDLNKGLVIIIHLKTRARLFCPHCQARLARSHQFCPACGGKVKKAGKSETEHRRLRTLPVDSDTLEILKDYISHDGPVFSRSLVKLWLTVCRSRGLPSG